MIKFNWILSLLISLSCVASCQANPLGKLRWQEDGQIFSAAGRKIRLEMQSVYDSVEYQNKTYVIGFKIDGAGVNTPYIAEISSDLLDINYWPFASIVNDIFVYRNAVYINDIAGQVFVLSAAAWQPSDLLFPENAKVVFSDGNNALIICHSSSPAKAANRRGGCYSLAPRWQYDFSGFSLEPKVCNNALSIFESTAKGGTFRRLALTTGEVLTSKSLTKPPKDICEVK